MKPTIKRRIKWAITSVLTRASWRLNDPHDCWVVEYWGDDNHRYSQTITGRHSTARAFAREHKGKIVGHNAITISAEDTYQ